MIRNHREAEGAKGKLLHGDLTEKVIGGAIEVHRHLGPGLLESAYRRCLVRELNLRKLNVQSEIPVPIEYKGLHIDLAYRLDIRVENLVIVELKVAEALEPIYEAQLLTYLRLIGIRVGLLINFMVPTLREGIKRMIL